MTKTLLWDFDHTLAYRKGWWRGCLHNILKAEVPSTDTTPDDIAVFLQTGFPWHESEIPHTHIKTADQWWEELLNPVLYKAFKGIGLENDLAQKCTLKVRKAYTNPEKWERFEDTIPTLEQLSAQGWRHIIASNHVPELPQLIKDLQISSFFETIFTSALVGYDKPNAAFFKHILDSIGPSSEIYMIGNSLREDIEGAKKVGIHGILVREKDDEGLEKVMQQIT